MLSSKASLSKNQDSPVQDPKDYKKPEIPEKYKVSSVAPESFRVYRRLLKEYLPKKFVFSKRFHKELETKKILFLTRAVTFDKCYYDKYTLNAPSEAFISESKNSSWHLMGSFGRLSLPDCQRKLLDEGWLFLPVLKAKKAFAIKKIKPPDKESPIYEAFKPQALKEWMASPESQVPLALEDIRVDNEPALIEVKRVKPVIAHPKTSEVDKSINAMQLALRLEAKKTLKLAALAQRKIDKLTAPPVAFSNKEIPKKFRNKQQMLEYIKTKMQENSKK